MLPPDARAIPVEAFPETMLRSEFVEPPIVAPDDWSWTKIPKFALPRPAVPSAVVPIVLPRICAPFVCTTVMPSPWLLEIRLFMTSGFVAFHSAIPVAFGRAYVPDASVPIVFA
jgi:hypothetical protein